MRRRKTTTEGPPRPHLNGRASSWPAPSALRPLERLFLSTEKVSRAWIAHAPARRALIGRGAPAGREQGEIRSAAAFSWQHGGR